MFLNKRKVRSNDTADLIYKMHQILLLLDFSLRLAPSGVPAACGFRQLLQYAGVAVTSQILCISITLNKGLRTFQLS